MENYFKDVLVTLAEEDFIGEYLADTLIEKHPSLKEDFYRFYSNLKKEDKLNLYQLFSFLGKDRKLAEFSFLILEDEDDTTIKASIITMIGDIGEVEHIPRLAKYLKHPERRVRANTVEALSKIGDRKIIDLLLPVMENEKDNRVLANTAIALWKFEDIREKVRETFTRMIDDQEKWMRASALYAFGETRIDDFLQRLLESVEDEDEDVCRNAVIALVGYSEILSKKN